MAVQELNGSDGNRCRNPFCGAPLANARMRFCESERRCQLYRCLELSAQDLKHKNDPESSASSPSSALDAAFVIPKRKIQTVALESEGNPVDSPSSKPALSRKRPLSGDKQSADAVKRPYVEKEAASAIVKAAAPSPKVRDRYDEEMEMIQRAIMEEVEVAAQKARMRADLAYQAALAKSTHSKNAIPVRRPPYELKIGLYDISSFEDASHFNLETFQDLFWRCRKRMNKPKDVPEYRLVKPWNAFARDWNMNRLANWFSPTELSRMRVKVHFECKKRKVKFCQVHLLEPGLCRDCGPTTSKYSLSPKQRARVLDTWFSTHTCKFYLCLWTMQQLRLKQTQTQTQIDWWVE